MMTLIWAMLVQASGVAAPTPMADPAPVQAPVQAPNPATNQTGDVVVTAHPLAATERALAECLARHCPPKEDIAASVAHAENQVVAGDYYGARKTLLAARGRDARYAAELPVEVGGLLRADARVTAFVGMPDVARVNQIDALDALKKGLPAGDARILAQRLEVGDAFAKQGDFDSAVSTYRRVGRQAHRGGVPMVEGMAMLREAILYTGVASIDVSYAATAADSRRRLMRTTDPALQPFRDAAEEMEVGLKSPTSSIAASVHADERIVPPHLVYQPVIDDSRLITASTSNAKGGDRSVQWADVSFHVGHDGTVENVVVLRHSQSLDHRWLDVARTALVKRRYTSYPADATPPGTDRVERYSFGYDIVATTGTHMEARSTVGRIDIFDLTLPLAAR